MSPSSLEDASIKLLKNESIYEEFDLNLFNLTMEPGLLLSLLFLAKIYYLFIYYDLY